MNGNEQQLSVVIWWISVVYLSTCGLLSDSRFLSISSDRQLVSSQCLQWLWCQVLVTFVSLLYSQCVWRSSIFDSASSVFSRLECEYIHGCYCMSVGQHSTSADQQPVPGAVRWPRQGRDAAVRRDRQTDLVLAATNSRLTAQQISTTLDPHTPTVC